MTASQSMIAVNWKQIVFIPCTQNANQVASIASLIVHWDARSSILSYFFFIIQKLAERTKESVLIRADLGNAFI